MSKTTIELIMEELKLNISETEKQELDSAFNNEFGLIGGIGYCEKLDYEWSVNPEKVKKIIYKILKKEPVYTFDERDMLVEVQNAKKRKKRKTN